MGLTGDERVAALEAAAARLVPLGARRLHLLPADEENEACLVMQDVEGNEFCLAHRAPVRLRRPTPFCMFVAFLGQPLAGVVVCG